MCSFAENCVIEDSDKPRRSGAVATRLRFPPRCRVQALRLAGGSFLASTGARCLPV